MTRDSHFRVHENHGGSLTKAVSWACLQGWSRRAFRWELQVILWLGGLGARLRIPAPRATNTSFVTLMESA